MSRVNKVRKDRPDLLEDNDFEDLLRSADKIHAVKVAAETEGGQALIKHHLNQVVNSVHILTARHQDASHHELISIIAKMGANLATARFLTTAKGDIEDLDQQIADMLKE